jgi:hypothetical protein
VEQKSKSGLKRSSRKNRIRNKAAPGQTSDFWKTRTVEELAAEQGVKPVESPEELLGDFWPNEESIDDFLTWLRELHKEQNEIH